MPRRAQPWKLHSEIWWRRLKLCHHSGSSYHGQQVVFLGELLDFAPVSSPASSLASSPALGSRLVFAGAAEAWAVDRRLQPAQSPAELLHCGLRVECVTDLLRCSKEIRLVFLCHDASVREGRTRAGEALPSYSFLEGQSSSPALG